MINSVKWSPCGRFLATASDDGTVKIIEFSTSKVLYEKKAATGLMASFVGNQSLLIAYFFKIAPWAICFVDMTF